MVKIYLFGIKSFGFLIWIASLWNSKARAFVKGRKNLFEQIENSISRYSGPPIWFHCSSLGEYELSKPLIKGLKIQNPETPIFVTFFSPSGFDEPNMLDVGDEFFYIPLDTPANAKRFLNLLNPKFAVFAKTDLWYFFLLGLEKKRIPSFLFSSQFRPGQIYFKPYGSFFIPRIKGLKRIFVINSESKLLLKKHNVESEVVEDSRFDRVCEIVNQAKNFPLIEKFVGDSKVLVIGSCWPSDLDQIASVLNEYDNLIVVLAPHDISANSILAIQKFFPDNWIKYSELKNYQSAKKEILIIDNIGMLSSLYQYADVAFVGGGFKEGLHNILEPAAWAVPVIYGPQIQKFPEALQLKEKGGGFIVNTSNEMIGILNFLLENGNAKNAGSKARSYVEENRGSVKIIIDQISSL